MATAPSLFGSGMGEEEMASRLLEQRAMQFAQMPQNQRLAAMGFQAGGQVGQALAGAFGVDVQDPAVRRATMLRRMAQQFDTNTPQGLRQLAASLQQTDPDMAMRVAQAADAMELTGAKIQSETALASQRSRERAAADPVQQIIRSGKYTPASVAAYGQSGNIADLELVNKDDPTVLAETAEGIVLVNKRTGEPIRRIGSAPQRGTKVDVKNIIPEKPADILKIRSELNATLKPFRDAVNAADNAIALADDALRTGNFASASALQRQLARVAGETQISNQDVRAFGGDPSLIGTVADVTSRLVSGTPTADTLRKMKQVAEILKKKNQALENQEINQTKRLARSSGNFTEAQIEDLFSLRETSAGPRTFNSVADAERANLPKGTVIIINGRRAVVE